MPPTPPYRRPECAVRFAVDDCDPAQPFTCPAEVYRQDLTVQIHQLLEKQGFVSGQVANMGQRIETLFDENKALKDQVADLSANVKVLNANTAPLSAVVADLGAGKRLIMWGVSFIMAVGSLILLYRQVAEAFRGP